jgi:HSP20 family protein
MFFAPVATRRFAVPTYRAPSHAQTSWDAIDQVFDELFAHSRHRAWAPSQGVRFSSGDAGYTLALDLPGLTKEQLSIQIEDDVVRIASLEDAPRAVHLGYRLPADIDAAASSAKLENGVLTLTLAKKPEVVRGAKLEIA